MTTGQTARKPKGLSPTTRTLASCRKEGWLAGVVERFIAFPPPGHRSDLFGFIDIVAIQPGMGGILAIQATTASNLGSRVCKIVGELESQARQVLEAHNRIQVWGWKKYAHAIDRKWWRPVVREIVIIGDTVEPIPF